MKLPMKKIPKKSTRDRERLASFVTRLRAIRFMHLAARYQELVDRRRIPCLDALLTVLDESVLEIERLEHARLEAEDCGDDVSGW